MHNQEAFPGSNTAVAILVAAGSASRMAENDLPPKQFRLLGGKPMLLWSIEALVRCSRIRDIVLVVSPENVKLGHEILAASADPRFISVSIAEGGATRTDSVRSGLATIRHLASHPKRPLPGKVLIHDAARPGLTVEVVEELLRALDHADAAAPALPVTDALKDARDGVRSVEREGLVRVQTPQAFRWSVIASAYASAAAAVDDLALVEASGARVVLTPGRQELMKVTRPEDMAIAEKLVAGPPTRVGTGFDVHGFVAGDSVTICGVVIPHSKKLEGHSDADVGWHALTDAILGAAALGDIGDHFPPSDPQWKGASSLVFLQHAAKLARERGFRVANADITLMCEQPKISPHRTAMRVKTAEALGIALDSVSVKATTTEKLGFLGREEGIAAQAVVLLSR